MSASVDMCDQFPEPCGHVALAVDGDRFLELGAGVRDWAVIVNG